MIGSTEPMRFCLAQFSDADALLKAVVRLRDEPHVSLDAFTPFPVDELAEAMRLKPSRTPLFVLIGGIVGMISMYALQYWVSVLAYPLNIGGRPLHSWPSFIPPTFEFTVLIASLAGIFGLLFVCGLPRLHHPVFEIDAFKQASSDGFFLSLSSDAESLKEGHLQRLLMDAGATACWEVPDA
ncbi:MAG: DUF3341 domain-containing protein [Pirellulaceae bacterium]